MDLGKMVQATQPVTFDFLGEPSTADVYIAGIYRLTSAQVKALQNARDEDAEKIQGCIPLLVKSWDVLWNGEPLAVEDVMEKDEEGGFVYPIPLAFVDALWQKAEGVFLDPTKAEPSQTGSAQKQPDENATTEMAIQ